MPSSASHKPLQCINVLNDCRDITFSIIMIKMRNKLPPITSSFTISQHHKLKMKTTNEMESTPATTTVQADKTKSKTAIKQTSFGNDKGDKIYCHHLFVNSVFICINFYAVDIIVARSLADALVSIRLRSKLSVS